MSGVGEEVVRHEEHRIDGTTEAPSPLLHTDVEESSALSSLPPSYYLLFSLVLQFGVFIP